MVQVVPILSNEGDDDDNIDTNNRNKNIIKYFMNNKLI
jgi:hypothetical protein